MANRMTSAEGHQSVGKRVLAFMKRWVTATNHKDIGTLYLCAALLNLLSVALWHCA